MKQTCLLILDIYFERILVNTATPRFYLALAFILVLCLAWLQLGRQSLQPLNLSGKLQVFSFDLHGFFGF